MFETFSRSWELVKASWRVLRSDKELIVFPIVSMLGMVVVTILFAVPSISAGLFDSMARGGRAGIGDGVFSTIVGFLFYVVAYTVIFYCNTALVSAAMIRLDGGDPTLADGFRGASQHAGAILGYAVISATVGTILNAIAQRVGIIGQIVISIIGFAWNVATFLVVPILVAEGLGPIEAIKRSAQLLKTTWGEQLVGNFSIGMVFGLIGVGVVFLIGLPLMVLGASADSPALIVLAVVLIVLLMIVIGVISSTLTGIYTAALYRFATQGTTGGFFDDETIKNAFRQK
jgi:hypothetical protein